MTVIDSAPGMDFLGILAGLVIGALAGAANGVVIARFRVPPFIATLAGLTVFRGASLVVTNGLPIIKLEGSFRFIGSGMIWGIPVPVIIMIIVVVVMQIVLSRTAFGACCPRGGRQRGGGQARNQGGWAVLRGNRGFCRIVGHDSRLVFRPTRGEGADAIAAVVLRNQSHGRSRRGVSTLIGWSSNLEQWHEPHGGSHYYQLVAKGFLIVLPCP
jgi:predicted ABC-type sugar transport system permease subunit